MSLAAVIHTTGVQNTFLAGRRSGHAVVRERRRVPIETGYTIPGGVYRSSDAFRDYYLNVYKRGEGGEACDPRILSGPWLASGFAFLIHYDEAERLGAGDRFERAASGIDALVAASRLRREGGKAVNFTAWMEGHARDPGQAYPLQTVVGQDRIGLSRGGYRPAMRWEGQPMDPSVWIHTAWPREGTLGKHPLGSEGARRLLDRFVDHLHQGAFTLASGSGPYVGLSNQSFVFAGGTSEYARHTVEAMLLAGAHVLVLGIEPERHSRMESLRRFAEDSTGNLYYVPEGADILGAPERFAATIVKFAEDSQRGGGDGTIHFGDYIYIPGCGIPTAVAMRGVLRAIAPYLASIFGPDSPTTPAQVPQSLIERAKRAYDENFNWFHRLVATSGLAGGLSLFQPAVEECRGHAVLRVAVPQQGYRYQLQMLARTHFRDELAEASWAIANERHNAATGGHFMTGPLQISRPVTDARFQAPVIRSRAMVGPGADWKIVRALRQAGRYGASVVEPEEGGSLVTMLTLATLLCDDAPGNAAQFHEYGNPLALAKAIRSVHADGNLGVNIGFELRSILGTALLWDLVTHPLG